MSSIEQTSIHTIPEPECSWLKNENGRKKDNNGKDMN